MSAAPVFGDEVERAEREAIEAESGEQPANDVAPRWPTPAELVRRMGTQGPRLPTGLPQIDQAWRGGARMGQIIGIMGAPGAGKTTWAVERAHCWACVGTPVWYIAGDEDRDGVAIRLGQQKGWNRQWLEDALPSVKEELASYLETLPLMILDPDEDEGVSISAVGDALRAAHPTGSAVLIIDSLQSLARRIREDEVEGQRGKVDALLKAMKATAKRCNLLILFLSEMNRNAYRFKEDTLSNDLAAAKESGGVEYEATALMMLRTVQDNPGLVVVTFPKSRMGRVEPFAIRQNYEFACFTADRMPESASPKAKDPAAAKAVAVEKACLLVLEGLAKGEMNTRAIREYLGGSREVADLAIADLLRGGAIKVTDGPNRSRIFTLTPNVHDQPTE